MSTTRTAEANPVTLVEARRLFARWKNIPTIVLAVSGGPDSTALMWLAARWRASLKQGPRLLVATVDHGLRPESAAEAEQVAVCAKRLRLDHLVLRWEGNKPTRGVPAAARHARYRLLGEAARSRGARVIATAHTSDDQAETILMRMGRGSGLAGLSGMRTLAPLPPTATGAAPNDELLYLARPFLEVPKARLIATLKKAGLSYIEDPTNRDRAFTRSRLRDLMPVLAREGFDAANLSRLARRLARANAALDVTVNAIAQAICRIKTPDAIEIDAHAFATLPEEIALRLLGHAIAATGSEGPAELAKLESLLMALRASLHHWETDARRNKSGRARLKQTLAGAVIFHANGVIIVKTAPPRRRSHETQRQKT